MAKKWTLLAYKELSADATTLDTADGVIQGTGSYFSKSRSLHVVMWGASASGGATDAILRFGDETNGIDSGSSYKWVRFRGNTSGAPSKENQSVATTSFYNSIFVAGNSGIDTWHFIEFDIDNTETQYKGVNSRTMRTNDSSLANALQTQWTSGEWSKTDRQCQRIQLTGSGGDSEYASGTGIAVYGYIDDIVSDEKDDITNVPINTRYEETDTRKIYRMAEKATSSQSTGSTGGWERVINTGQTNWSVDFMGQKFEAGHELIGQTINSISFDLSKNGSVADVLKLAKANSSNTITVLESIPISSVSSSGSGGSNSPNFTTMTFDSFTPFVLQADDKLGIYASGTMGGNSSDPCSGSCTYVEIAHTSSSASANETRYGIANDGTNFTTGNHDDDIKYSIGVSPSMKIWKERGTA